MLVEPDQMPKSPLETNKYLEQFTHHLFIFANPRSGDQAAAKFLHPEFDTFKVTFTEQEISVFNAAQRGKKSESQVKASDITQPVTARCFIFNVTQKAGRENC